MKAVISDRLKKARNNKHLTQTEVHTLTGINNKTLSGYENQVSEPDLETLKILSDLYDVTTDYLLGRSDIPNPVQTIAAHRTDSSIDDLPPEAIQSIEDFKKFVRAKYKKD